MEQIIQSIEKINMTISPITEVMKGKVTNDDDDDNEIDDVTYHNEIHKLKSEEQLEQRELYVAGNYLQQLIKDAAGDVAKIKSRVVTDVKSNKLGPAFKRVLQDNIYACSQAGYINKTKLFEFILDIYEKELIHLSTTENENKSEILNSESWNNDDILEGFTTYHAPKFVDSIRQNSSSSPTVTNIEVATTTIDGSVVSTLILKDPTKNNKKNKRILHKKMKVFVEAVDSRLRTHGVAVADNIIPLDIVRRVRIEAGLFTEHYEQSEVSEFVVTTSCTWISLYMEYFVAE